ncbi:Uncharacterised protein [Bordetella pertussis]|nr:Uncharacterised protein [Bordetella pertussis]
MARAMNSFRLDAGTEGLTTRKLVSSTICVMLVKSRPVS